MNVERKIRVIVAKPGLDGHDRGAKVLTFGLRDEGFEVIYTGLRQSPEAIAKATIQEDADVVGLSCLSGAHKYLFPEIAKVLREQRVEDVLLIGGGIIDKEDIPYLKENGFSAIFSPETSIKEIAKYIRENVRR